MPNLFSSPSNFQTRRQRAGSVCTGIILCFWLISAVWAQSPSPTGTQTPAPTSQEKILSDITQTLQQQIQDLTDQLARLQAGLTETQNAARPLGVAISTHKAALSLDKLSIDQAKELQQYYAKLAEQKAKAAEALTLELEKFTKIQSELQEARQSAEAQAGKTAVKTAAQRALEQQNRQYLKLAATAISKLEEINKVILPHLEVLNQEKAVLEEFSLALQKFAEDKFKQQLLERESPANLITLTQEFFTFAQSLPQLTSDWVSDKIQSGAAAKLVRTHRSQLTGLLFFLGILLYAKRLVRRATRDFRRQLADRAVTFSMKFILALLNSLSTNFYLLAIIAWLALSFWVMGILHQPAAKIILGGFLALTSIRLVKNLLRGVFAPGQQGQGIVDLDPATASYYCRYGFLALSFLVGGYYFLWSLTVLGYQNSSLNFAALIYLIVMFFWFAWLLRKPYLEDLLTGAGLPPQSRLISVLGGLRLLVLLGLSIIIVIDLLGFRNLAYYLAGSACATTLVIAGVWLLGQMSKDLNTFLTSADGFLSVKFSIKAETLKGVQFFFAQASTILITIGALSVILLIWGVNLSDLKKILAALSQGPSLGPINLSPLAIFLAGFSLWVANKFSRFIRLLLETGLFRRREWDIGIQHTISKTVHYILMTIGIIAALGFLGVNFSNLAIIAGGLGVGIGFGLQNIVNNFLSGLILLFERPIKVGDLLVIDGQWGTVKAIRVRSTVFETSDRSVFIIPNSDLVSNKILNWTFFGRGPNRLTLNVGVSYSSNVHEVTKIIDQVCRANDRVLLDPPPQIYFNAYGDSSLDFIIWVFLQSPGDRVPATHELNAAIFDAFNRLGIEMPFPQRDIHIRSGALPVQPVAPPKAKE